jgi:hypothetical protein
MATYSEHEQRMLDQKSGEELDAEMARWLRKIERTTRRLQADAKPSWPDIDEPLHGGLFGLRSDQTDGDF